MDNPMTMNRLWKDELNTQYKGEIDLKKYHEYLDEKADRDYDDYVYEQMQLEE